ncbi:MAG: TetR/AcrR family transcriptional regulator [Candidatus Methylacidiphilales bacterium]|nr:TetR/AcrR family transcriptional regulator [Candidatus Methylacidiphilales bacterium]
MRCGSDSKEKLLRTMIELIWESSYGSASVDDICNHAGVKKGSFYHFYPSKADLAAAAMEHHWQEREPEMDQIFSSQVSPWERLSRLAKGLLETQREKQRTCGKVLGCPFFTIGVEMSTQEEKLRLQTERMNQRYLRYYESAIREGIALGEMAPGDPVTKARQAYAYVMGLLLQAKVLNETSPLELIEPGLHSLLGVRLPFAQAA